MILNSHVDFFNRRIRIWLFWSWIWKYRLALYNFICFIFVHHVLFNIFWRQLWTLSFDLMRLDLLCIDSVRGNLHLFGWVFLFNDYLNEIRIPCIPNTHLRHCFLNSSSFEVSIMQRLYPHISQPCFQFKILLIAHSFHMHSFNHFLFFVFLCSFHPTFIELSRLHLNCVLGGLLLDLF